MFGKILNNRLVQCLDKGALHEGQAGFRLNRGCMDNVYTLNEIVQGRLREDKKTYAFSLDIQKAYDTTLPEDRYSKRLFNQEWNIKPRRGRQRKVWSRMVDDLFKSVDIDKGEWLEDIERGDSSSALFLACVEVLVKEKVGGLKRDLIRKLN